MTTAFTAGNDTTRAESRRVADPPQFLTLKFNRDRTERVELVIRRTTFAVITLIGLLALGNVFGQRPKETAVSADAADLEVFAPMALRGGLYYEGRLTVEPKRDIEKATLVLDSGWTEQMQINTIEPSPVGEASRGGKLTFDFGHLAPDDKLVVYMQFQVNPTNLGRRSQDVELYDDTTFIARADRTVTVLP
jgi:hypothetical protein